MRDKYSDIAIIGAGPAGIAAALQFTRYNILPVVFEKNIIGGLLNNARKVENYPGFPKGIAGTNLVDLFQKQLEYNKMKILKEKIKEIDYSEGLFHFFSDSGSFKSKYCIIATGTFPKAYTLFTGKEDLLNKLLFYEVYPLRNDKNQRIVVVGAGDAAFDYALTLSSNNQVYLINRENKPRCNEKLKSEVFNTQSIKYEPKTIVQEINKINEDLYLNCISEKGNFKIVADYCVAAVGREPVRSIIGSSLAKYESSLIQTKKLFEIGDFSNGRFRQASIAVGDGVRAAMEIFEDMIKEGNA